MTTLQTHVPAGRHRRTSAFLLTAVVLAVPATVSVLALGWQDVPPQAPIAVLVALLFLLLYVGVRARVRRGKGAEVDGQLNVVEGRSSAAVAPPTLDESPRVEVDPSAAAEFLEQFHAENPHAGPAAPRIADVLREIDETGTYRHTSDELTFGARLAWRNNARCIGRLYWQSLQVRDLRNVTGSVGIAELCFDHLRSAYNRGKIRPMISVFAPDTPSRPGPKIWNEQLIRYAGYAQPDGSVLGDPRYVDFTRTLMERGWRPPEHRGAFDVLPLVVETAEEGPRLFPLPPEVVDEVPIEHPELTWFADLGLRWHAVPVIRRPGGRSAE